MKQILNFVASLCYGFLSLFIPKKKEYYAFRLFHDPDHFSGNIKALMTYIKTINTSVEIVLLTNRKAVVEAAKSSGIAVKTSFLGRLWATLRAQYLIIDSYTGLYRFGNFSLVQLGHGAGYKNIGLLRDDLSPKRRERLKKIYQNYKLVITTSESNLKKKNASFAVNTGVITGLPRNDVFFENNKAKITQLKQKLAVQQYFKIITYAPTFRDFQTNKPFTDSFWTALQGELEKQNAVFIIKKHPWDELLEIPDIYKNIKDVSKALTAEELLLLADLLITDYSSIATDFALTGKPILIYAYDLAEYKKHCRSIYYELETVLPEPFLIEETDLLDKIKNLDWCKDSDVKERYVRFQKEFHLYLDGHSSERVFQEIQKLSD